MTSCHARCAQKLTLDCFAELQTSREAVAIRNFTSDEGWSFSSGDLVLVVEVCGDDSVRGVPIHNHSTHNVSNNSATFAKPPRSVVTLPRNVLKFRDEGESHAEKNV